MIHPLDRPVWSALTTTQAYLARGDARAWRIDGQYGYFAAAAGDDSAPLAALVPEGSVTWIVEPGVIDPPAGTVIASTALCHQMVASAAPSGIADPRIVPLGEADAAAMRALAALTRPGPFLEKTHRLGDFVGIREGGSLIAMAGERLRPEGYTEVSAVCCHADHRGRGYARSLMAEVMRGIVARGDLPFLHVYSDNAGAIALYEALGFVTRRTVTLTVLARG